MCRSVPLLNVQGNESDEACRRDEKRQGGEGHGNESDEAFRRDEKLKTMKAMAMKAMKRAADAAPTMKKRQTTKAMATKAAKLAADNGTIEHMTIFIGPGGGIWRLIGKEVQQ